MVQLSKIRPILVLTKASLRSLLLLRKFKKIMKHRKGQTSSKRNSNMWKIKCLINVNIRLLYPRLMQVISHFKH